MIICDEVLSLREKAEFKIREIFQSAGFERFRMAKFEEYDLYAQNRNFLSDDRVITFTDSDGRLLALKPDVTMSILKSSSSGAQRKVYYAENVYRPSKRNQSLCEIRQVGGEIIGGDINESIEQMIELALSSLKNLSDNFVLNVSHLGFVKGLFEELGISKDDFESLLVPIRKRNAFELENLLSSLDTTLEQNQKILKLIDLYGDFECVKSEMEKLGSSQKMREAIAQMQIAFSVAKKMGFSDKIVVDFSIVNNISYYNGIVVKGYIEGSPDGVLDGGEYSSLAKRLKVNQRAIGFCVSFDDKW